MGSMSVVLLLGGYCERGLIFLLYMAARYRCSQRSIFPLPIADAPPFFAAQVNLLNSLGNQHAGLTCRLRTAAGRPR
jgi:hypothetical protein